MRRRLLLIVPVAVVFMVGIGAAVFLTRTPPGGTLETNVTDVTVVTPSTTTAPRPAPKPKPQPKPATEPVDRRCWTMFGGGPRRTLARPAIDLGVPAAKPLWARGLKGYMKSDRDYVGAEAPKRDPKKHTATKYVPPPESSEDK